MKIGDRVQVRDAYPHKGFHGATGTVVEIGMFVEVKLDDEQLHPLTAWTGIGLFMEDELARLPET